MNCCDYKCNQGRNCPARQACELPITMDDDEQPITFDDAMRWLRNVLAGIGFTAMLVLICFFFGYHAK